MSVSSYFLSTFQAADGQMVLDIIPMDAVDERGRIDDSKIIRDNVRLT